MKVILTFFIHILIYIQIVYCQNQITIAVLELDASGFSKVEAKVFTERLRTEIFKTGKYTVLERDKMNDILTEQGFQLSGCVSNECVVEAGRLIGVEYMVVGSMARIGALITVNIRMIDVETAKVLAVATEDCECRIEEFLMSGLNRVAVKFSGSVPLPENEMQSTFEISPKRLTTAPDRDLVFAKALFLNNRFKESQATFHKYLNKTENAQDVFNAMKLVLEISDSKQDIEILIPPQDGNFIAKHTFFIQKCNWLLQYVPEYKSQVAEEVVMPYFTKLRAWEIKDYSQDILISLMVEEIEDSLSIALFNLVDWNRNTATRNKLGELAETDISSKLLAEVLNQKIILKLPGYKDDIIYFETLFPNHEYLFRIKSNVSVNVESETSLLSKKISDKIYLSGLEKIEIFINGRNIMQKNGGHASPIFLKENSMQIKAYYHLKPDVKYLIKVKTFNYGDEWVFLDNRGEGITVRQKEFNVIAPPKKTELDEYIIRIKINQAGKVSQCTISLQHDS